MSTRMFATSYVLFCGARSGPPEVCDGGAFQNSRLQVGGDERDFMGYKADV